MPLYELLDTATLIRGRRYTGRRWGDGTTTDDVPGDEVELDQEQGDRLEAMGAVRPSGVDDHNLVDDERDLPGLMSSPQGRIDIARKRMGKRSKPNRKAQSAPDPAGTPIAPPPQPEQRQAPGTPGEGREKSSGRRG